MTDKSCDALIQTIQAGLNALPELKQPDIKTGTAIRVDSYPTSPIICKKAFSGHSTVTIVDLGQPGTTEVSQKLCDSLPNP